MPQDEIESLTKELLKAKIGELSKYILLAKMLLNIEKNRHLESKRITGLDLGSSEVDEKIKSLQEIEKINFSELNKSELNDLLNKVGILIKEEEEKYSKELK